MDIVNFGNSCFLTLVSTLKLLHRMQILCLLEIYSILLIGMIKMYEITVCLCHKDISHVFETDNSAITFQGLSSVIFLDEL